MQGVTGLEVTDYGGASGKLLSGVVLRQTLPYFAVVMTDMYVPCLHNRCVGWRFRYNSTRPLKISAQTSFPTTSSRRRCPLPPARSTTTSSWGPISEVGGEGGGGSVKFLVVGCAPPLSSLGCLRFFLFLLGEIA